jgi:hypothetical protein
MGSEAGEVRRTGLTKLAKLGKADGNYGMNGRRKKLGRRNMKYLRENLLDAKVREENREAAPNCQIFQITKFRMKMEKRGRGFSRQLICKFGYSPQISK